MRPALRGSLRRPSATTFLRHAADPPCHGNVCYGCETLPRPSRREQRSSSNTCKKNEESLAKSKSAKILTYVPGLVKRRQEHHFELQKRVDLDNEGTGDLAAEETIRTNQEAVKENLQRKPDGSWKDAVTTGSALRNPVGELNAKRQRSSMRRMELEPKTWDSDVDYVEGWGERQSTVSQPRIKRYLTDGILPKGGLVGHRKSVIENARSNIWGDIRGAESVLEGDSESIEQCMDVIDTNDFQGFRKGFQSDNLLVWDRRIPTVRPMDPEHDLPSMYDALHIDSVNILTPIVKLKTSINWTTYLTSFKRLKYESDVGSEPSEGPRLIDCPEYASDFELWLRLVQFRQRHHGVRGLLPIWEKFLGQEIQLPIKGQVADLLWSSFLNLGFENHGTLDEIISYATILRDRTGDGWEMLYYRIVRHLLERSNGNVYHRHSLLYRRFPPTREQYLLLFHHSFNQASQSQRVLQQMYKDLPFRDLYSPITEFLLERQLFLAAASWHEFLVAQKDLPEDAQEYKILFRHMYRYGNAARLASMVHQMIEAKIPLPSFINQSPLTKPFTHEMMNQQLADTHGIEPKTHDDQFHSRLFATKFLPVDVVFNLLQILGTNVVGPTSLRELIMRLECNPQAIQARVEKMKEMGFSLGESIFSRLVLKLVETGNTTLLENVATCDLHSDTFEDADLQESLLVTYHNKADQLQFDRTLAIIMMHYHERYHKHQYWNIHLRLHLRRKDISAVSRTLDMMQASRIEVEIKSMAYVRISLMTRRRVSVRPTLIDELPLMINIWQRILCSGGTMPAHTWVEILRRLGMSGKLEEYEKLALWLVDWYTASPARVFLGGRNHYPPEALTAPPSQEPQHPIPIPTPVVSQLQTHHPLHPLRVLFPKGAQQAVLAWGFQHARIGGPDWRWGLYMLLKLRKQNVHIERLTVAKACRLRLLALFGPVRSNRLINRRQGERNWAELVYYIREMEKIAGRNLFEGPNKGIMLPQEENERWRVLAESIYKGETIRVRTFRKYIFKEESFERSKSTRNLCSI